MKNSLTPWWRDNHLWSWNVVTGPKGPIMSQLTLIAVLGFHFRLHFFHQGDKEGFHTHPRAFVSVCVRGAYRERLWTHGERLVKFGTVTVRRASTAHNVEPLRLPCVTVAFTSPVINRWRKFKEEELG